MSKIHPAPCSGSLAVALMTLILSASPAAAATMRYVETFDDDTLGDNTPSEGPPESGTLTPQDRHLNNDNGNFAAANWSVVPDGGTGQAYRAAVAAGRSPGNLTGPTARSFSGDGFTDLNTGDFSVSTEFTYAAMDTEGDFNAAITGIFARTDLSSSPYFSGYHLYYRPSGFSGNDIVLGKDGSTVATSSGGIALEIGATYRLGLSGTGSGTDLYLVGSLTKLSGASATPISLDYLDTTPSATYNGAGLSVQIGDFVDDGTGSSASIDFDNFEVIPEPSSLTILLLAGGAGFLSRRRPI